MALLEAKLALQPSLQGVEYKQEDLELLTWFSNVTRMQGQLTRLHPYADEEIKP